MRIVVASVLLLAGAALAGALPAMAGADRPSPATITDLSTQSSNPPRARTRIRITPARRIVRQCDFKLVQEVRASGTYVVPRERCWWARR